MNFFSIKCPKNHVVVRFIILILDHNFENNWVTTNDEESYVSP